LEGLEISVISLSALERTRRMDSQFYSCENLLATKRLDVIGAKPLTEFAIVSDGNHMGISENFIEEGGVPYYRGQDVGHFFIEQAHGAARIDMRTFSSAHMERSRLSKGDVLLSIVGTIGGLSLVKTDTPAACSCKLAILRPKGASAELLAIFLQSRFGQIQIHRFKRGAVQMGLILEDFDQLKMPGFSAAFGTGVVETVNSAFQAVISAKIAYSNAEICLLKEIGLHGCNLNEASANVKSFKNSFGSTGRLDAEYYQPKYEDLLKLLRKDGLTIADVAPVRSERFQKTPGADFQYLEIGGLRGDGSVASETVACDDAPSRASQRVRQGDIITSTVHPIRRLSALVAAAQDGYVCSSGFVVLQPKQIAAEVLLVYLRLPAICELMDLHTSASLYPAISEKDLLGLPIPKISDDVQRKISTLVQQSFTLKAQSARLLEAAKRAVEIAIEQDEAAGMAYLSREISI